MTANYMLKIYPLSEKKNLYPILAYWSYNNWYITRNVPFKLVMNEYRRRAENDGFPSAFVAFWGELPVGMVSIKETDMQSRRDLSPWLSALYVSPEYRKRGVGNALIETVLDFCSANHIKRIFLFIDSRYIEELEKFYKSRNWIFLEEELDSEGNITQVLFHEIPQK
jgi:GNAT superfamily N-acetyltransferase